MDFGRGQGRTQWVFLSISGGDRNKRNEVKLESSFWWGRERQSFCFQCLWLVVILEALYKGTLYKYSVEILNNTNWTSLAKNYTEPFFSPLKKRITEWSVSGFSSLFLWEFPDLCNPICYRHWCLNECQWVTNTDLKKRTKTLGFSSSTTKEINLQCLVLALDNYGYWAMALP